MNFYVILKDEKHKPIGLFLKFRNKPMGVFSSKDGKTKINNLKKV